MCLVTPYAGVSIATIIRHPDWRNKLSEAERTRVFAVLAAHTMTVHATLQDGNKVGYESSLDLLNWATCMLLHCACCCIGWCCV